VLSGPQKLRLMELLSSAVQDLLAAIAVTGSGARGGGPQFADARDAKRHASKQRNAFKALTYMFAIAVQVAEKTSGPASAEAAFAAGAATSRGRKAAGGAKVRKSASGYWGHAVTSRAILPWNVEEAYICA
jgi:hypothetical protein